MQKTHNIHLTYSPQLKLHSQFNLLRCSDIEFELANKVLLGFTEDDSGYELSNGKGYAELRNVQFLVDRDYIFPYQWDKDPLWYIAIYEPELNKQYSNLISQLYNNPKSRQAVFTITNSDNIQCTMYVHIFLDKIENTEQYSLTYIVHMRSNDVIEFTSDIEWHKKILNRIKYDLSYIYEIVEDYIIWNADSMQLYDKYWKNIFNDYGGKTNN